MASFINAFAFDKDGNLMQPDEIIAEIERRRRDQPEPGPEPGPYNVIGGREYRTTVIGNLEWLAESLDYAWDGLPTVTGATVHYEAWAAYYKDNKETYGKYGLMYNWYAVKYLDDHKDTLLPAGWRVPTHEDMLALTRIAGIDDEGNFKGGYKLKSVDGWASGNNDGTDEYGFTLLPGGQGLSYPMDGDNIDFRYEGKGIMLWQIDDVEEDEEYAYALNLSSSGADGERQKKHFMYVRLVRDAK